MTIAEGVWQSPQQVDLVEIPEDANTNESANSTWPTSFDGLSHGDPPFIRVPVCTEKEVSLSAYRPL